MHFLGFRIVDHVGGAADVRNEPLPGIVDEAGVNFLQQLVLQPEGPEECLFGFQFVVAHQNGRAVGAGERAHAVGPPGNPESVVHEVAGAADDLVFEPVREVEDVEGIGLEFAEP